MLKSGIKGDKTGYKPQWVHRQGMKDVPQPAAEPYSPGDRVRVYLGPGDPDSALHGVECEVIDRYSDDLDSETGRELDKYTYRVKRVDNSNVPGVEFRHRDLVPVD